MRVAKFWAKAKSTRNGLEVLAKGWSDHSEIDAKDMATRRAEDLARKLASGDTLGRYLYGDRPLAEPTVQELKDRAGSLAAVVTRNSYGCLVLNAERLFFADVDGEIGPSAGFFSKLFGKSSKLSHEDEIAKRFESLASENGIALRLYKTAAGYRIMATSEELPVGSRVSEKLLEELKSDPLYRALCKRQECYRARLTPKPWRCSSTVPPVSFPFEGGDEEKFLDWQRDYDNAAKNYATCNLISTFGSRPTAPELEEMIELHDSETKAQSGMPLA
jgi:hypothetical protein